MQRESQRTQLVGEEARSLMCEWLPDGDQDLSPCSNTPAWLVEDRYVVEHLCEGHAEVVARLDLGELFELLEDFAVESTDMVAIDNPTNSDGCEYQEPDADSICSSRASFAYVVTATEAFCEEHIEEL